MRKLRFTMSKQHLMGRHDAAYLSDDDDVAETLADSVVQSIATEVEITIGGVVVFLAMLLDPEHWEEDWAARGITDAHAWLTEQVIDDA